MAFSGCENLEHIEIPDGVTSIGEGAFYGCKSLKSIRMPKQMNRMGAGAFEYCEKLTGIDIPQGVKAIEERTFFECYPVRARQPADRLGKHSESALFSGVSFFIISTFRKA